MPSRILGLDFGGIAKDEPGHFDRRLGGEDRAAKPVFRQQRQSARVVEMRMGEDYGVQSGGRGAQRGDI
jgi:hypothetical protein